MYYFAYGSNMNHSQMKCRCPEGKFLKRVFLKGYRIVYDGYSSTRGGAVANIIETGNENDIVWGGLFEISETDLKNLDNYEGYPVHYDRKWVFVIDDSGIRFEAIVYYRKPILSGKPSKKYLDIVLEGAKDCKLPEEYINEVLINPAL